MNHGDGRVQSSEGSVLHSVVMAGRGLVGLVTAKQGGVVAMWGRVRWRSGKASQGDGKVAFGGDSYAQAIHSRRSEVGIGQGMILYCAGGVE